MDEVPGGGAFGEPDLPGSGLTIQDADAAVSKADLDDAVGRVSFDLIRVEGVDAVEDLAHAGLGLVKELLIGVWRHRIG